VAEETVMPVLSALPTAAARRSRRRLTARAAGVLATALVAVTVALPTAAHADASEDHFAARANQERTSRGLAPLTHVADLQAVARQHSQTMAAKNTLYHNPSLATQVTSWSRLSENVGYGPDAETVHVALMNSAGHRANILDKGVSQIGVGVAYGGGRVWVTQVFRAPTGSATTLQSVTAPPPPPTPVFQPPAVCAGAAGSSFADVPTTAWYAPAVDCATGLALAQGVTKTTYVPHYAVTRAQMASFVHRALLKTGRAPSSVPDYFRDDAGSPHETAINTLAHLGVVAGTSPGVFSPDALVTRGQTAALLVRLQEKLAGPMPTSNVPFTDIAGTPHATAINKVYTAGIATGTSATGFSPAANVRRDAMAVLLVRSVGKLHTAGLVA
jgi:uncharacterized protein YkwD